jgi:hypothetical protein
MSWLKCTSHMLPPMNAPSGRVASSEGGCAGCGRCSIIPMWRVDRIRPLSSRRRSCRPGGTPGGGEAGSRGTTQTPSARPDELPTRRPGRVTCGSRTCSRTVLLPARSTTCWLTLGSGRCAGFGTSTALTSRRLLRASCAASGNDRSWTVPSRSSPRHSVHVMGLSPQVLAPTQRGLGCKDCSITSRREPDRTRRPRYTSTFINAFTALRSATTRNATAASRSLCVAPTMSLHRILPPKRTAISTAR